MFVPIAAAWPGINTPRQLDKPTTTRSANTAQLGKPHTKISAVLRLFVRGWDLNRIDAAQHCERRMASTVSRLENRYGIVIARQRENAPGNLPRATAFKGIGHEF